MKIPAKKELAFQLSVTGFVVVVGLAAALLFTDGVSGAAGTLGAFALLLLLFVIGLRVTGRAPGGKNRS